MRQTYFEWCEQRSELKVNGLSLLRELAKELDQVKPGQMLTLDDISSCDLGNVITLSALSSGDLSVVHVCHQYVNWIRGGRVTYDISPDLSHRLALTKCQIPLGTIPWPVHSMQVSLENSGLRLIDPDLDTKIPLRTLLLSKIEGAIAWHCVGKLSKAGDPSLYGVWQEHPEDGSEAPAWSMSPDEAAEWYVDKWTSGPTNDRVVIRGPDGSKKAVNIQQTEIARRCLAEMQGVVRYIANLLMYLTSEKADIVKVGAAANTSKVRKGKATALPHRKVGYRQSFRISRDVDLNKSVTGVSNGRIQVSVRHVVSGHWKYQPCGKGRAERKHIWVEPYFRGPDIAEVVGRTVEC